MGFLQGVWRLLGAEDDDAAERTVEFPQSEAVKAQTKATPAREQLIAMPTVEPSSMFVLRPSINAEGQPGFSHKDYAAHLRKEQAVIVDVNELAAHNKEDAVRLIDYLSGVAEAVDGTVWEITTNIFVFTPKFVKLGGDPLKQVEVS